MDNNGWVCGWVGQQRVGGWVGAGRGNNGCVFVCARACTYPMPYWILLPHTLALASPALLKGPRLPAGHERGPTSHLMPHITPFPIQFNTLARWPQGARLPVGHQWGSHTSYPLPHPVPPSAHLIASIVCADCRGRDFQLAISGGPTEQDLVMRRLAQYEAAEKQRLKVGAGWGGFFLLVWALRVALFGG